MLGRTQTRWLAEVASWLLRAGDRLSSRTFWAHHSAQAFDLAILGLLAAAPLVWGGRHEIGRLVFAVVVMLGCAAWAIQRHTTRQANPLRLHSSLLIPLVAALWLLFQVAPLPSGLLQILAPGISELLPLWHQGGAAPEALPQWGTISLTPQSTLASLAVLTGYGLTFFLVLQWLSTIDDIRRLLGWIAMACGFMALFGLLQHFTADGRFFWVYDHPFRDTSHVVCGSFINRNHFAHFVGIGIIAGVTQLVLSQHAGRTGDPAPGPSSTPHRSLVWMVVIAVSCLALLLSFSRGGIASTTAGVAVAVGLAWRYRLWTGRQLLCVGAAGVVVMAILAFHRGDRLVDRLDTLGSGSLEELDRAGARRMIWEANLRAIGAFWLTGTGAGSHREVAPAFQSESRAKPYTHAECGYLQILTETGVIGGGLLVATLGFVAAWTTSILRTSRHPVVIACTAGLLGGLTLSLLHSLIDFVWYIPATMTLAVMLLAMLCRLADLTRPDPSAADAPGATPRGDHARLARGGLHWSLAIPGLALCMGLPLIKPALASSAWEDYLIYSAIQSAQEDSPLTTAMAGPSELQYRGELELLEAKVESLRETLAADPQHYLAHVRLAQTYLQLFEARAPLRENRQGLAQIEATVAAGGFASGDQVCQWLERAVGKDIALLRHAQHHARQAIGLSPLDGTAYVCLAHVGFLEDPTGQRATTLLQQAVKVRPHDGQVLFEYGKSQLMAGDVDGALKAWKDAFVQPGPQRILIVQIFGGRAPAAQFLETFAPDWQTLPVVWQQYFAAQKPAELQVLLAYARQQAEAYVRTPGNPAAPYIWRALATMHRDTGDSEGELACLEAALREGSSLYPIRHDMALALARHERYREAQAHFRWCLAVHPENKGLRQAYQQALEAERTSGIRFSLEPTSLETR